MRTAAIHVDQGLSSSRSTGRSRLIAGDHDVRATAAVLVGAPRSRDLMPATPYRGLDELGEQEDEQHEEAGRRPRTQAFGAARPARACRRGRRGRSRQGRPLRSSVALRVVIGAPSATKLWVSPAARSDDSAATASVCASAAASSGADGVGLAMRHAVAPGSSASAPRSSANTSRAAEDHDRPVAHELDLLQLRGVEQHRRPCLRQIAQQQVDLRLGGCRSHASGRSTTRLTFRRATGRSSPSAGCRRTVAVLRPRPGACRSGVASPRVRSTARRSRARLMRPQCRDPRRKREGDVLAHGALHEERLGTVGSHVHQPGADGVGGMAEGDGHAIDQQLFRRWPGTLGAGQDVEQLVLPLASSATTPSTSPGQRPEGRAVPALSRR